MGCSAAAKFGQIVQGIHELIKHLPDRDGLYLLREGTHEMIESLQQENKDQHDAGDGDQEADKLVLRDARIGEEQDKGRRQEQRDGGIAEAHRLGDGGIFDRLFQIGRVI